MPHLIGKHPRGASQDETDRLADLLENMIQDAIAVIPDDSSVEIQEANKSSSAEIFEKLNDGIYVLCIEDALFVKRLQYLPGKIRVKSDNPMYELFEINPNTDNVKIIGNFVYTISKVACI